MHQVESIVSNISSLSFGSHISPPLEHSATYSFSSVVHIRGTACVQRKFEGVYLTKNHRNNLLFSYYKRAKPYIASLRKTQKKTQKTWSNIRNKPFQELLTVQSKCHRKMLSQHKGKGSCYKSQIFVCGGLEISPKFLAQRKLPDFSSLYK